MKYCTTRKFWFLFFSSFLLVLTKFFLWKGDWALRYNSMKFWDDPKYTMFITSNHTSFHLRWKENLLLYHNASKHYEHSCRSIYVIYIWLDCLIIFIVINCIISWIQTYLFFCLFYGICTIIFVLRMLITFKQQKFSLRLLLSICLIFCVFFANFSVALLIKVLLI